MSWEKNVEVMTKKLESGIMRSPKSRVSFDRGDAQIKRAIEGLSAEERSVLEAVCTIANDCIERGEDMVFTPEEVYHIISGASARFTEEQKKTICRIIERLRAVKAKVDMTKTVENCGLDISGYEEEDSLICVSVLKRRRGNDVETCYCLLSVPLLLEYAAITQQEVISQTAVEDVAYDRWKLQWLQSHKMGFSDICKLVGKYISETVSEAKEFGDDPLDALKETSFSEYVEENGFSGMLWPCFNEWAETEGEGKYCLPEGVKVRFFRYSAKETGANEMFVAVSYSGDSGILYVTGLEYSVDDGYAYFVFDECFDPEIVEEEDVFNKDGFLAYMLDNDTKGFSSAWYSKVKDVQEEYPDDDLLGMLLYHYSDTFAERDGEEEAEPEVKESPKAKEEGMNITLSFSKSELDGLRRKFDIESEQDLQDAVLECISTYMEL